MKHLRAAAPLRFMLFLTLSLTLTACGFRPRGESPALPAQLTPLSISGIDNDHPLYIAIQKRLDPTALVSDAGRAAAVLTISGLESRTELLTIAADNKTSEQELIESFSYTLRAGGHETMPQRLSTSRIHYVPGDAVLARAREAETLRKHMRGELADRLVRRLAAWQ